MNFCSRFLRLSVFPWCKDSPQIVILWQKIEILKAFYGGKFYLHLLVWYSMFLFPCRPSTKVSSETKPFLPFELVVLLIFHYICFNYNPTSFINLSNTHIAEHTLDWVACECLTCQHVEDLLWSFSKAEHILSGQYQVFHLAWCRIPEKR